MDYRAFAESTVTHSKVKDGDTLTKLNGSTMRFGKIVLEGQELIHKALNDQNRNAVGRTKKAQELNAKYFEEINSVKNEFLNVFDENILIETKKINMAEREELEEDQADPTLIYLKEKEIREDYKLLDDQARLYRIWDAVKNGEDAFLKAIANSPTDLGLPEGEVQKGLNDRRAQKYPQESALIGDYETAKGVIERNAELAESALMEHVGR